MKKIGSDLKTKTFRICGNKSFEENKIVAILFGNEKTNIKNNRNEMKEKL